MSNKSWESLVPEPLLLLSGQGEVVDANLAARKIFRGLGNGMELHDLAIDPAKIDSSIRNWARSGDFIRGQVVIKGPNGERYTTYGARLPGERDSVAQIIVRCRAESAANQRFVEITRQVHALKREVARRQQMESQLFAEKELAQVTLKSIGDAVITTDTEGCVNYLNPIAESLTGWSETEARGLPLLQVFDIINEHTRLPAENPVARVIANGHTVGLANHTVLLHRDGTEFAIEDSAAPIHDRAGRLIGVVMVFHDVSHARQLAAKVSIRQATTASPGSLTDRLLNNACGVC